MDWKAEFNGRQKGAIGIMHPVVCMVTAKDRDGAVIRLYDNWECITGLKLEPAKYEKKKDSDFFEFVERDGEDITVRIQKDGVIYCGVVQKCEACNK